MLFKYKAKKMTGEDSNGEREALDKFALARELRGEGLVLTAAEEIERVEHKNNFFSLTMGRVSLKEKIIFANNLSSMITAGLSLSRALSIMERQSKNKFFKKILSEISTRINKGDGLSKSMEAFPDVFPPVFTAMVSAGEESGKLPESLEIVAEQLNKTYELRRKIRGAMIYPTIIVTLIIVIGALMMVFLVPTLTATFKELEVELPLSTRIVVWISDFLNNHLLASLGLVLTVVAAVVLGLKTKSGRRLRDWIVLHLPVIGNLARSTNAAVTMRTVASLITSGVSMIESIQITERVLQNSYYKTIMADAAIKVERGINLSEIFKKEEKFYPILVGEMAEVGEETGKLAEMLKKGAIFYEEEVDQATKNLSTIVEPALMVIIGVAVGFFAISMIGPMYSLSEAI